MSVILCHMDCGVWIFRAITRWLGNIGYGFIRTSYLRSFLPSNSRWRCSGGLFSAHRKHFLAWRDALSTFAAEERILAGLCCSLTSRPPTVKERVSTFFNALKFAAASGHTESWSPTNFSISLSSSIYLHLAEFMAIRASSSQVRMLSL